MEEKLLNEHGIDIAIEIITIKISEKMDEYNKTRDKKTKNELVTLLTDKDKIYKGDIETIKKYL